MKTVVEMALDTGFDADDENTLTSLERFAELVRADERNKLAAWMIQCSYATGHGDTTEDLLKELEWQVREGEREACAKVCENEWSNVAERMYGEECAAAIRARGETK